MRDKAKLMSILSKYQTNPEQLEKTKKMLTLSKRDFMEWEMERVGIIERRQNLFAEIVMPSRMRQSEEHSVCTVTIRNEGETAEKAKVEVTVDRNRTLEKETSVPPKGSVTEKVVIPEDVFKEHLEKDVRCSVDVMDGSDRTIASENRDVLFEKEKPKIKVEASIALSDVKSPKSKDLLATITLRSNDPNGSPCTITGSMGSVAFFKEEAAPKDGGGCTVKIHMPEDVKGLSAGSLSVKVMHDSAVIASSDVKYVVEENAGDGNPVSDSKIFAECTMQSIVDIRKDADDHAEIGRISYVSREKSDGSVTVILSSNGRNLLVSKHAVKAGERKQCIMKVPISDIAKDESYSLNVNCRVLDTDSKLILSRSYSVKVRSRFDLDLGDVVDKTAEFVNPLSPPVVEFVDDRKGALAKVMGKDFFVCGYQGRILEQLQALWKAVVGYGMHYVSDTETLKESGKHYQKVRTPDKVLKDHSGNCIELSILFASMLEAMGFDPIVIFPHGHAIVGITVLTNAYQTEADARTVLKEYMIPLTHRNGKNTVGLFFESTMCDRNCSFESAVESAAKTLARELASINSREFYSIIPMKRSAGIQPRMV